MRLTSPTSRRRIRLVRLLVVLTTLGLTLPAIPAPAKSRTGRDSAPRRVASRVHAVLGALASAARSRPVRPAPTPIEGSPLGTEAPREPAEQDAPASESEPLESSSAEDAEFSPWVGAELRVGRGPRWRGPTLPFDPAAACGSLASRTAPRSTGRPVGSSAPTTRDLPTQLCRLTC